ncbi:MAG: undecaprenyldiphospho-muramoylpentapeptide beta-N-acetylglucosaminyltransferase [Oscillospiraceae bacterium]|nr:undecaprenyldiphospho-muramoylpentapeptide beta-N-acetylglucosaminyltransferase [Oscillospiraceae bacterium]
MRILFACGGTAGHINPAIAVASLIRKERHGAKFLFAGHPDGMEATLVPKAGFDFTPIEIQGFQRRITPENIRRNLNAARLLLTASAKAKKIIQDFEPDVAMGTGGYVSGPVILKAAKMGIRTITHEQNAFPGVTTKLLAKNVDKVLLAVSGAEAYLPRARKYIVTGNPIRQEILYADREKSRLSLGVGNRICLLTFGGSLGALRVNEAVADLMAYYIDSDDVHFIHATGRGGAELFPKLLYERGVSFKGNPHIDIREYIHDMPQCLAAADLVLCRAGAVSLSELEAAGRASILIPSPNVAENHQYHNAMVLANKNAAIVIEEKNLTGERLCRVVGQLVSDPQELVNLGRNAHSMSITDAAQRICREIYSLLGE